VDVSKKILIALAVVVVIVIAGLVAWQLWPAQPTVAETVDTTTVAEAPQIRPDDIVLGDAKAPVTIVEYYSLSCPHCAHFDEETLPQIKTAYIDNGKVRLVLRDFPLNRPALQASLLAHCVPQDGFFSMTDLLFKQQSTWLVDDSATALANIAKTAGIDQAKFEQCLNDKAAQEKIINSRKEAEDKFKVNSTPTFLINDQKLEGARSFDVFKSVIDAQLAK
jgi:protein-disulfide isomerase